LKRKDDFSSAGLQDFGRQSANKILPDKSGIRRGCGRLSRPQLRATGLAEFKPTFAGILAPQDWQILDFKTVLPALAGSIGHRMEISIKKYKRCAPSIAFATSPLVTAPSVAIHPPSFLFEHLLDAG
jgi:hypothetical protein